MKSLQPGKIVDKTSNLVLKPSQSIVGSTSLSLCFMELKTLSLILWYKSDTTDVTAESKVLKAIHIFSLFSFRKGPPTFCYFSRSA